MAAGREADQVAYRVATHAGTLAMQPGHPEAGFQPDVNHSTRGRSHIDPDGLHDPGTPTLYDVTGTVRSHHRLTGELTRVSAAGRQVQTRYRSDNRRQVS